MGGSFFLFLLIVVIAFIGIYLRYAVFSARHHGGGTGFFDFLEKIVHGYSSAGVIGKIVYWSAAVVFAMSLFHLVSHSVGQISSEQYRYHGFRRGGPITTIGIIVIFLACVYYYFSHSDKK